jgi:hypothetical protein
MDAHEIEYMACSATEQTHYRDLPRIILPRSGSRVGMTAKSKSCLSLANSARVWGFGGRKQLGTKKQKIQPAARFTNKTTRSPGGEP